MSGTGAGPARRWRLVRAPSEAIPASVRRFNERRRARRMASLRPFLIAGGVALLVAAGAWIVYGTSLFGVATVRVTGSGFVGAPAIRSAAAVRSGTPLASVDLGAVAARVEKLVPVRRATVSRDWPSTLVVDVTLRTAVATVPAGPDFELVDAGGVVFRTVSGRPDLPLLNLSTPGPDDESTRAALSVLRSLPRGIRDQLGSISAPSPAGVVLALSGGRKVIWGDASDNAAKGRVATTLLKRPGTVIDVSAPNVVTVR